LNKPLLNLKKKKKTWLGLPYIATSFVEYLYQINYFSEKKKKEKKMLNKREYKDDGKIKNCQRHFT